MKKEDLMAKGLSAEHAQIAMDAYTEALKGFIPKSRFDEVNSQLKTANDTIETLKKGNKDNEALQKEVEGYKAKIKTLEAEAVTERRTYALKEKLREAGVVDADYVIYKQGGIEKWNFDKDGAPIGVDEILTLMKKSSPHLFKQEPGYNPAGGGTPSKNPFAKETWNLTEQGKLFKENPTEARQLASAAGITL